MALQENASLQHLDLSWNGLQTRGVTHFGDVLRRNVGLKFLGLSKTRTGAEACLVLAEGIKVIHTRQKSNHLKHLLLSCRTTAFWKHFCWTTMSFGRRALGTLCWRCVRILRLNVSVSKSVPATVSSSVGMVDAFAGSKLGSGDTRDDICNRLQSHVAGWTVRLESGRPSREKHCPSTVSVKSTICQSSHEKYQT